MVGTRSLQPRAAAFLLFLLVSSGVCQNIDIDQPIVRSVPAGQSNDAYFGYTLTLHQTVSNPADLQAAVSGARYVKSSKYDCMAIPGLSLGMYVVILISGYNSGACGEWTAGWV